MKQVKKNVITEIDKFNADCKAAYGKVFADLSLRIKPNAFKLMKRSHPNFPKMYGGQQWAQKSQ